MSIAPNIQRGSLICGVAGIIGGEALCFFGPQRLAGLVDRICHAILYTGMAMCALGAALYLRSKVLHNRARKGASFEA